MLFIFIVSVAASESLSNVITLQVVILIQCTTVFSFPFHFLNKSLSDWKVTQLQS